jgi:hypothetical protein
MNSESESAAWLDDFVFGDMWDDFRHDGLARAGSLREELSRELALGHPLCGIGWVIVARSVARDDVVVRLAADTGALVHLTYAKTPPENPPHPSTLIVRSAEELQFEMAMRD